MLALSRFLTFVLLFLAISMAATTAHAIWTAPQEVLIADLWGNFHAHLMRSFPANLFVTFNGHVPVVTAWFWLADLHFFGGLQRFTLGAGVAALATSLLCAGSLLWRDKSAPASLRLARLALLCGAVTWFVHAPNLARGSECIFLGLPLLAASAMCLVLAKERPSWIAVSALCLLATFSHGFGLVLWPTAVILAWIVGARGRTVLALTAVSLLVLLTYPLLVPPMPIALTFEPLRIGNYTGLWLAGPFFHLAAGLGITAPNSTSGWNPAASVLGFAGIMALLYWLLRYARSAMRISTGELVGLAAALIGAGIAGLIGITRGSHFELHPMEVFAPRYQIWTCLFWWGLAVLGSRPLWNAGIGTRTIGLAGATLALVLALPAHFESASRQRDAVQVERVAALAYVVGVDDHQAFATLSPVRWNLDSVRPWMKEHRAGVFAWRLSQLIGTYDSNAPEETVANGAVQTLEAFPGLDGGDGFKFSGWTDIKDCSGVIVTDLTNQVVGLGAPLPRWAAKQGEAESTIRFAGYVYPANAAHNYRYQIIDSHGNAGPRLPVTASAVRPLLRLDINSSASQQEPISHRQGTPLQIMLHGRRAGQSTALYLVEVAGIPCVLPLWSGPLDKSGTFQVALPTPLQPQPVEIVLKAWTVDASQGLVESQAQRILLR